MHVGDEPAIMISMEVEVIRSTRRRKTISARLENGRLIVRAPASISEKELNKAIETLKARTLRRQEMRPLSDAKLHQRAQMLNRRYFGGKLHWNTIRWVTNQQKRFGSCTPSQKTIRISHRIGKMPQWVQDYVIIHELAHLLQGNHGPHFWELMSNYPLTERARGYLMAVGLESLDEKESSDDDINI